MRRLVLCTVVAILAVAAVPAVAKAPAIITLDPNTHGKGSHVTTDLYPPKGGVNPKSVILRVAKGFKFDRAAVKGRCKPAEASDNKCPANSRIGGGFANATVTSTAFPTQHIKAPVDLFLAPPPGSGDKAGVVLHIKVKETGEEAHVTGSVRKINITDFGLEVSFDDLDKTVQPPAGFSAHVDRIHLQYGANRKINGKRHFLIRNPKTCDGSWRYWVIFGYRSSGDSAYHGAATCT
jgi:hypothetical protein